MARARVHLPTLRELMLGMTFFGDKPEADAAEFASRQIARFPGAISKSSSLRVVLHALTMLPTTAVLQSAARVLRRSRIPDEIDLQDWALRCDLYAAAKGSRESAIRIGAEALSLAADEDDAQSDALELFKQGLGWLSFGSAILPTCAKRADQSIWCCIDHIRDAVEAKGDLIFEAVVSQYRGVLRQSGASSAQVSLSGQTALSRHTPETSVSTNMDSAPGAGAEGASVVVCREVGNSDTVEGRRITREFAHLIGKGLPLIELPDLRVVHNSLIAEFPYAQEVAQTFLDGLSQQPRVAVPPTILVGIPGCGKTHFAELLLRELGVPHETYPCGGVADASLAGTARRWSTGEPSLPINLIRRFRSASPGIILDEIEKVSTSAHNGRAHDALLGLLERETAARWHDPYIEAPVDLSHVIWVATANSVDSLSGPLRDRCRVLRFPEPSIEHLPVLAPRLLVQLARDRGLDARWAEPLTIHELEVLSEAWPGGSVRLLRRMLEAVFSAREKSRVVH